ncbi:tRNA 2-selenouridine(34) synthase MnmH [Oceanibium sediminis]|uniref:tRNA 2-selenouridine(34) synthase MnmH n=1 Tax=Oceanibium sediminis TaxID=2026339 RepID=UPI000DD2ED0D|nr:tRNA 2-selenouridine(34) synthase MnmH [Oceanibium sediminis]
MRISLPSLTALHDLGVDTIIDVRSPAEFAEDHVPGAINLPALSNAERAEVGTLYVQVDRFEARKVGAAMVARNAAAHLDGPLHDKTGAWRPLVYCWRGGQRSGSFAAILEQIGWRVSLLEGGYRSYRRLVVDAMHKTPLSRGVVLLDGNTGTAKTEILAQLAARGLPVVDLEGLASHRGSVFGHVGTQPSQKAFEGALAAAVVNAPGNGPILMEAESSKVGERQIPPSVWSAMRAAPRIRLSAPLGARADYLVRAYADMSADVERLTRVIAALTPLQGTERVESWTAMAREGRLRELAAELMQHHYDPRYAKSAGRNGAGVLRELSVDSLTPDGVQAAADAVAGAYDALITPS